MVKIRFFSELYELIQDTDLLTALTSDIDALHSSLEKEIQSESDPLKKARYFSN